MAGTFRDILLQLTGESAGAEATLDEVSRRLDALAARTVRVGVELTGTERVNAEIAALETRLAALGARTVQVDVKVNRRGLEADAEAALAGVRRTAARVLSGVGTGGLRATVPGPGAAGADVAHVAEDAAAAAAQVGQSVTQMVTQVDRGRQGVVGFGFSLVGLTSALVGVGVAILVTALPALAALAASLAGAVVALGGLATALAAVAGPVVLVAVGAFLALAKVFAAFQAARQAQTLKATAQGHLQASNAAIAHTRAVDGLRRAQLAAADALRSARHQDSNAQNNLSEATRNLGTATRDAYRAWHDAIESVRDALRDVEHAQLGVQRAKLDQADAVAALQKFRKEAGLTSAEFNRLFSQIQDVRLDPAKVNQLLPQVDALALSADRARELKRLMLDVADANLGIKDSTNRQSDAETTLGRSVQRRNEFVREGAKAYAPLRSAVRGLADAQFAAAESARNLSRLERDGVKNAPQVVAARDQLRSATQGLHADSQKAKTALESVDKALRPLVGDLVHLAETFKTAMAPVISDMGRTLHTVITDFDSFLKDAAPGIKVLGEQIGESIRSIAGGLTGDRSKGFFKEMFADAPEVIDNLTGALKGLFGFLGNVAQAAMPALKKATKALSDTFGDWDANTRKGTKRGAGGFADMTDLFNKGVDALGKWLKLIGALSRLILDFFQVTSGQSGGMLESLTKTVNKWDEWVRDADNAKKIHEAVDKARDLLEKVFTVIGQVTEVFIALLPIATDVINAILELVRTWIDLMKDVFDAVDKLPGPLKDIGVVVAGFVAVGGPFALWKLAVAGIRTAVAGLASLIVSRFAKGGRARRVMEGFFDNLAPSWRKRATSAGADAAEGAAAGAASRSGRLRSALRRAWTSAGDVIARVGRVIGTGAGLITARAFVSRMAARLLARGVGVAAMLAGVFGAESLAAAALVSMGAVLGAIIGAALVGALIGTLLRKIPFIRDAADKVARTVLGDKAQKKDDAQAKISDKILELQQKLSRTTDPAERKKLRDAIHLLARQATVIGKFRVGGVLPGFGGGDIVPALLEPGEGVLRKEVVASLGPGLVDSLNASYPSVSSVRGGFANGGLVPAGGRGGDQIFNIPPAAPAHPQPDPRSTAALLSLYMRQQGLRG